MCFREWAITKVLLAVLLATATLPVRADELGAPLDPAIRQKIVEDTDKAIRDHFAHWQALPAFDYERQLAEYRKAAFAAPDRRSFSLLTRAFVASLNNGHTQFNDELLSRADPGNLGFALRYLDTLWVVTRSRRAEIPPGSIVTEIDGEPFEAFFQRNRAMLSASNERTRRTTLTSYPFLFPLRFSLMLKDGSQVAIDRTQALPPSAATAPETVSHRWIVPGRIGYLAIGSFGKDAYEKEARQVAKQDLAKASALIIDLRGNGGGNTPSGLGRDLLGADWLRWKNAPPKSPVPDQARALPAAPRYILIVDRSCGSACEDFAISFAMSAKAVLVGETTAGSSGQPKFTDWGNGMKLWVGSRRQWFPDGREFEGVGIRPDIAISLKPEDFQKGAPDVLLQCAESIARGDGATKCRK
jgi:carboxyl-terminal processing protease